MSREMPTMPIRLPAVSRIGESVTAAGNEVPSRRTKSSSPLQLSPLVTDDMTSADCSGVNEVGMTSLTLRPMASSALQPNSRSADGFQ